MSDELSGTANNYDYLRFFFQPTDINFHKFAYRFNPSMKQMKKSSALILLLALLMASCSKPHAGVYMRVQGLPRERPI